MAKITRQNETVVSVVYEPSESQQKNSSENGVQGQFVVQYDVDRSSIERKGGEIHVIHEYLIAFLVEYFSWLCRNKSDVICCCAGIFIVVVPQNC